MNDEKDFEELHRLAEQGDSNAMYKLGLFFCLGDSADFKKAFYWYKLAAERGHTEAQYALADCYALDSVLKSIGKPHTNYIFARLKKVTLRRSLTLPNVFLPVRE